MWEQFEQFQQMIDELERRSNVSNYESDAAKKKRRKGENEGRNKDERVSMIKIKIPYLREKWSRSVFGVGD